jgi:hypothetical protein
MGFKVGDRVLFKKAGRHPTLVCGAVSWLGSNPDKDWADVECDDGVTRKARPASMTRENP